MSKWNIPENVKLSEYPLKKNKVNQTNIVFGTIPEKKIQLGVRPPKKNKEPKYPNFFASLPTIGTRAAERRGYKLPEPMGQVSLLNVNNMPESLRNKKKTENNTNNKKNNKKNLGQYFTPELMAEEEQKRLEKEKRNAENKLKRNRQNRLRNLKLEKSKLEVILSNKSVGPHSMTSETRKNIQNELNKTKRNIKNLEEKLGLIKNLNIEDAFKYFEKDGGKKKSGKKTGKKSEKK